MPNENEAQPTEGVVKLKKTKAEKKKEEEELRKHLPSLSQVTRNGVYEMCGSLAYTWAQGNVPGGPFVPVNLVCHGHNLYIFEGGEAGHRPSAKPRALFQIKRAEVEKAGEKKTGLLLIPPLPPHNNVFKITFAKKQFGHKAFFFKSTTNKEMERWLKDLLWRVNAPEGEIRRLNEPAAKRTQLVRLDETQTAVSVPPTHIVGMAVRYVEQAERFAEPEDDYN